MVRSSARMHPYKHASDWRLLPRPKTGDKFPSHLQPQHGQQRLFGMEGWFHVKRVPLTWSHNALRAEVLFAPAWCILGVLSAIPKLSRNGLRASWPDWYRESRLVSVP